ncbi:MAG: HAD family phosphatase [Armatimonadota bacterium]|nr:HAD family phosphatase [bacterium]
MSSIKLIIFDLDDTLIASGPIWRRAEVRLFRHLGSEYSSDIAQLYKGMSALDVGRTIHQCLNPSGITGDQCGQLLREWLIEEFKGDLQPMTGATELIANLYETHKITVASGSPREAIQGILARFGWNRWIDSFTSSEEVSLGKPHPDVFLEAAKRLNYAPDECLVIEDSLHGVHAAHNAGMTCFAVPSSCDPQIGSEADRVFQSLCDISSTVIKEYKK